MSELDKGLKNVGKKVESKEGDRGPLSSNKANVRSPSLEFISNSPLVSTEMKLDYLARILVAIFLEQKKYGSDNYKEGSSLLQSVDERASG